MTHASSSALFRYVRFSSVNRRVHTIHLPLRALLVIEDSEYSTSERQGTHSLYANVAVKDLDNSGSKNSGTVLKSSYKTKITRSFKRSDFISTVKEHTETNSFKQSVNADATASYGPVSADLSTSLDISREVRDFVTSTKTITTESSEEKEEESSVEYSVAPGDRLMIYQQVFNWPEVKPIRYLSELKIQYTNGQYDGPAERIRELQGKSEDLNNGRGGQYAWLVPTYSYDRTQAATSFELIPQRPIISPLNTGMTGRLYGAIHKPGGSRIERIDDTSYFKSIRISGERKVGNVKL
ncbi:hypothetical protein DL96DRAFT_1819807 [Flagelloscypha sp. PMI_526]|nr:hypothetical protein DL96DRAFT_1819807 [Flagelloscypha sp. PMI_526]